MSGTLSCASTSRKELSIVKMMIVTAERTRKFTRKAVMNKSANAVEESHTVSAVSI